MNRIVFVLLFLLATISENYSQSKIGYRINRAVVNLEYGLGAAFLQNSNVSDVLSSGDNLGLGLRFNIPKKIAFMNFYFNLKKFTGKMTEGPYYHQDLDIAKLGIRLNLCLYQSKNRLFSSYAFLDLSRTRAQYYYSYTIQSNIPFSSDEKVYFDIFDERFYSMSSGVRIYFHLFFIEGSYDITNPIVDINEESVLALKKNNVIINPAINQSMNAIGFRLGMTVPLGFLGRYKSVKFKEE